jgi:3-dehydroquinate synthase
MPTTVRVALGQRSYDILIGRGLRRAAGDFLRQSAEASHAIVVTDDNVRPLYGEAFASDLRALGFRCDILSVPAGEPSKSIKHAEALWHDVSRLGCDRRSTIVALGGGVVGDLAGFIAATFMRGLPFVQIPTTLLAQVDSSVGGKVGINLPAAKNTVGAFWQPAGVLIDLDVLTTLPEREYRAGLAEVVKYGVILDAPFFAYLEQHIPEINRRDPAALEQIVARCCELKARVVEQDERELTGVRAVLNYGHTFCHAIETVTGYGQFLHGEAVAIGMACAARLAESMGRVKSDFVLRQRELLEKVGLTTAMPRLDEGQLLDAMRRDKKAERGKIKFILPMRLGCVEVVSDVDPELVRKVL